MPSKKKNAPAIVQLEDRPQEVHRSGAVRVRRTRHRRAEPRQQLGVGVGVRVEELRVQPPGVLLEAGAAAVLLGGVVRGRGVAPKKGGGTGYCTSHA